MDSQRAGIGWGIMKLGAAQARYDILGTGRQFILPQPKPVHYSIACLTCALNVIFMAVSTYCLKRSSCFSSISFVTAPSEFFRKLIPNF